MVLSESTTTATCWRTAPCAKNLPARDTLREFGLLGQAARYRITLCSAPPSFDALKLPNRDRYEKEG